MQPTGDAIGAYARQRGDENHRHPRPCTPLAEYRDEFGWLLQRKAPQVPKCLGKRGSIEWGRVNLLGFDFSLSEPCGRGSRVGSKCAALPERSFGALP